MTNAQESKLTRRNKTLWLTQTAILAAIIIFMSFTPLGYLKVGVIEITFIMIPVAIGAIIVGPSAGFVLGGVWGITSFIQCFGMSPFGALLLSINPIYTFIMCIPVRILAGGLAGLLFKAIAGIGKNQSKVIATIACPVASLAVAVLNTVLFMTTLMLFFGDAEFIVEMRGGMSLIPFMAAFVGAQGVVEAIVTFLVSGAVSAALIIKFGTKKSTN